MPRGVFIAHEKAIGADRSACEPVRSRCTIRHHARIHRTHAMPRMKRKSELPSKPCVACGRPFAWRRKWARDWDAVKCCSERCRRARNDPEKHA